MSKISSSSSLFVADELWIFMGKNIGMLQIETLLITPEILSLIAEIDEFKGAWRALGQLAPEQLNRFVMLRQLKVSVLQPPCR